MDDGLGSSGGIDPPAWASDTSTVLSGRSREIFRHIVDAFMETGEPIGSRTVSRRLGMRLSPATIRNVMADLEDSGLLRAPHTSAGRLPTDAGLRLFVDGFLEIGNLTEAERESFEARSGAAGRSLADMLNDATEALSTLSSCAGLVVSPKVDRPLKHMELVSLAPGRALVIMVTDDGQVENRVLDVPVGLPSSALIAASNFLNTHVVGRTLAEARAEIAAQVERERGRIDALTADLVARGLADYGGDGERASDGATLIVRGHGRLLADVQAVEDLETLRELFGVLETRENLLKILEAASQAEGVRIFIGAENTLFSHSGCAMIVAPFRDTAERVVGAVGVVGPTRLNYARIVPMVDYTARMLGRFI